ncbi:MAG: EF-Tu/IF-2/RF-3 family GTPase, partial [Oscillospiraceae bacterium]
LAQNLSIVIVINKIDRPDARIKEIIDEILMLLMDLGATDEQLDSPMIFCSGREGIANFSPEVRGTDFTPIFDTVIDYIKAPDVEPDAPFAMLVSNIDYNSFVGRTAVGRIEKGSVKVGQDVTICDWHDETIKKRGRITALYAFEGTGKVAVESASAGDIVVVSGLEDVTIGNTICDSNFVAALPFVAIDEPTVEMTFAVNDSPFAGKEGKFVTSRQIRDRLYKELLKDVALRVKDSTTSESFQVMGRGEMHLSILIENMRREGYEFQVSPPRVLLREENGKLMEPFEHVVIDVPTEFQGSVIEKLSSRKAELVQMAPQGDSRMRIEFKMPARGLFGYRSEFLTDTKGSGVLSTIFDGYQEHRGELPVRSTGSLVSFETGTSIIYGLYNAQERGQLFIGAGEAVYAGMVVGVSPKSEDLVVNVCKKKQLTNTRASGSDDALRLVPFKKMSLEESLEFLAPDELVEVTPKSLRIRKSILDHSQRAKQKSIKN